MADSKVDITAGTGTEIDTRTESTIGQHRQVVVLGDPATNAGVAPVDATNGVAVDVKQIAAGTNNIGDVDIDSVVSGKTRKSAAISAASSGDNTLVAALASNKTKVVGLFLVAAGDVNVRLEDGAGGTALTGVISLTANNGFVLPLAAHPDLHWFETSVNTLLNLELSAAVQVSGALVYYQEA